MRQINQPTLLVIGWLFFIMKQYEFNKYIVSTQDAKGVRLHEETIYAFSEEEARDKARTIIERDYRLDHHRFPLKFIIQC